MCDTIVALGKVTTDGVTLFGKNSDREPNEAHHLLKVPSASHSPESWVKCTYIEIPQVEHTYAVLLAKPFWIWGAEMGVNEHGVAIGNEAVFSKVPYGKQPGLIGMDFLRLGLERAATAQQALSVITELLAQYGQSGNCGLRHKLYYHNSFIIADPHEAWVLETAGKHWVAKQVKDVYAISNGYTIGSDYDLASPDVVDFAIEKGWCKRREAFNFAQSYADFVFTTFSFSRARCARSAKLLEAQKGHLTIESMIAILRDHGGKEDWRPDKGLAGSSVTICWHAGMGPLRASQSVGSLVSHLHADHPTHFATASSAPCTGIFKPLWVDVELPDLGPTPQETYDSSTYFWRHEALHRAILRDYRTFMATYRDERDVVEKEFIRQALACAGQPVSDRKAFMERCFSNGEESENRWLQKILATSQKYKPTWHFMNAWKIFNRQARMPTY